MRCGEGSKNMMQDCYYGITKRDTKFIWDTCHKDAAESWKEGKILSRANNMEQI